MFDNLKDVFVKVNLEFEEVRINLEFAASTANGVLILFVCIHFGWCPL